MKLVPLALLLSLTLVAPMALTSTFVRSPVDPGADQFPWQALEPCKYGRLEGTPGAATLFADDFEAGQGAWSKYSAVTRPNLWHWSTFPGNNSAFDHVGHGGPGRMYYGIENAFGGTFNTDPVENRGEIRSPPVTIPAGSQLVAVNLNTKWHVEWDRPTHYDAMVFGYVNEAGQRTLLCYFGPWKGEGPLPQPGIGYFVNSPTGALLITGCKPYVNHYPLCQDSDPLVRQLTTFDLAPYTNFWESRFIQLPASLAGQTVQLTFFFYEGDPLINDATGWMIDDVNVVKVL